MFAAAGTVIRTCCHARSRLHLHIMQQQLVTLASACQVVSSQAAAPFSSAAAASEVKPGQAFLASLIDYEKVGVPKAAGVTSSSCCCSGSNSSSVCMSTTASSSTGGFDLAVMHKLLAAMGDPHKSLSVVHVAGTKGKGSVVVLLSAMLQAAGYTVGTYTSPHMFDIRERVVVGRSGSSATAGVANPVNEQQWDSLAVGAKAAVDSMMQQQRQAKGQDIAAGSSNSSEATMPSHFEVITAMAFQHFADQEVDIAVVETGLGGSCDATNVFDSQQLQLAVITAIGMDHVDALGGSLSSIAAAKAGILKPGVPVVVGPQCKAGASSSEAPPSTMGIHDRESAGKSRQQQQQPCLEVSAAATPESAQQATDMHIVLDVLQGVASRPEMQCPLIMAQCVVQVVQVQATAAVSILPGPGNSLARQAVNITAADTSVLQRLLSTAATGQPATPARQQAPAPAAPATAAAPAAPTSASSGIESNPLEINLGLHNVCLQLVGSHQLQNVQTAVAAALLLRQQGFSKLSPDAVKAGLQQAWLPGRFQVIQQPNSSSYTVLDGAHTADSAAALARTLRAAFPVAPVVLVLAMAADKEHREVCEALRAARPSVVVFTSVPIAGSHARAAPPGTLAAHWQAAAMLSADKPFRCRQLIQANIGAALEKARHELGAFGGRGVIVVTGSLHAVAAAIKHMDDMQ